MSHFQKYEYGPTSGFGFILLLRLLDVVEIMVDSPGLQLENTTYISNTHFYFLGLLVLLLSSRIF